MFHLNPPHLLLPLEMVQRFSNNIAGVIHKVKSKAAAPLRVYHYTNGPGFIGIIESFSLWATHVAYMNDTEEYFEASRLLAGKAKSYLSLPSISDSQKRVLQAILENLGLTVDSMFPWFVTCFSECKDDLAQWRGYSGKESKFSIGFETKHLDALVKSLNERTVDGRRLYQCYLLPAVYAVEEKMALIDEIILFMIEQYPKDEAAANPHNLDDFVQKWVFQYVSLASILAPAAKNESFKQEREWRLVSLPIIPEAVKYRNRGSLLTPYMELKLQTTSIKSGVRDWGHPIREIWVGPSPHTALNSFASKSLLEREKLVGVDINPSSVPYRDL